MDIISREIVHFGYLILPLSTQLLKCGISLKPSAQKLVCDNTARYYVLYGDSFFLVCIYVSWQPLNDKRIIAFSLSI